MTQPPDQAAPPRDARPDTPRDHLLLERFLEQGDDAAFAELVERHGPMVRATCRRCLGDSLDADEVFQATFVILARKAASVRGEVFGPWLHRVAVNAAHRAAAQARRRRNVERQVASMPERASQPSAVTPEWLGLFHEELERLPERYRAALVLCELQGQGRAEAAETLGVPEGTLSSRLARGRVLLRRRLMRRGVVVTAVALSVVLAEDARAEVPPDLVRVTVRAVTAGAVSAPVAALIEGVLRAMFLNKVKTWAIVCALAVGLTGAAVPLVLRAAEEKKPDEERIQAAWEIVTFETDDPNESGPPEQLKKLVLEKGQIRAGELRVGEYKFDPKQNPKQIEITLGNLDLFAFQARGQTFPGIYEIKDEELKFCFTYDPNGQRPKEFSTKDGTKCAIVVLKRAKADK